MKIYQINTVCGYGSTGRIAADIGNYLTAQNHDCRIAYGRNTGRCSYNNAYFIGSDIDHKIHGVRSRITDRQGCYSRCATKELIDDIRKYSPDIIHLHNLHGYYLNYQMLFDFLGQAKLPIVWTFHDCWPFTGHCTYFDLAKCDKWKTGCGNCPQKNEYPASVVLDQSKRNYQKKKQLFVGVEKLHIVTPSQWLNELVNQSFLKEVDHRVINNGIDLSRFSYKHSDFRKKHGIQDKQVFLGVASIWGERKGYSDFIKLSNVLGENQALVMIGLNDKQLHNLPSKIVGIKRTNSVDELAEVYSAADYFLNLTYQDNFPTANIEALACGTPVITYNTGGSGECVTEDTGWVIPVGSYSDVLRVSTMRDFERGKCIERSKAFSTQIMCEAYMRLYKEV